MHMLQLTGLTLEVDMSHVVVVVVRRWPPIGLPATMTFISMNCASNYATQVDHATLAHLRVQHLQYWFVQDISNYRCDFNLWSYELELGPWHYTILANGTHVYRFS